jgi:hypothetical protein
LGHATGTWFNQLISSTLLYFITFTNTSSFRLTRFITARTVVYLGCDCMRLESYVWCVPTYHTEWREFWQSLM